MTIRLTAILLLAALTTHAEIISSAMLCLPAATESIEYDNLFELRRLPNYQALRQRFSGPQLEEAKAALNRLAISESQVHEIVMGTSPGAFYGLVSGTFSAAQAIKSAQKASIQSKLLDGESIYCPKGAYCVVFLEDSLAAFGTAAELKTILEARLGSVPPLRSNRTIAGLMAATLPRAPVRGAVYGSQLKTVLADALQDQSGLNLDWTQVASNISAFGYSVSMDSLAHVTARLECKSPTTAGVVRQLLSVLGGVESVATKIGKDPASMPFQHLQVSVAGSLVDLKMDTPVPTS